MAINFNAVPEQAPLIDYSDNLGARRSVPLTQDSVDIRKSQYTYLIPEFDPAEIENELKGGNENFLQDVVVGKELNESREIRENQIRELSTNPAPTQHTQALIQDLAVDPRLPQETARERALASQFITDLMMGQESTSTEALEDDRDKTSALMNVAERAVQKAAIIQSVDQELQAIESEDSIFSKVGQFAFTITPLAPTIFRRRNVDVGAEEVGIDLPNLPGNRRLEQVAFLHTLPPEQFKQKLSETVQELASFNTFEARQFLDDVRSFSNFSQSFGNVELFLDASDFVPFGAIGSVAAKIGTGIAVGSIIKKGAKSKTAVQKTSDALESVVKEAAKPEAKLADTLSAAGQTKSAATVEAIESVNRWSKELAQHDVKNFSELLSVTKSLTDPHTINRGVHQLSKEATARLFNRLTNARSTLLGVATELTEAQRLNQDAIAEAIEEGHRFINENYRHPDNAVLDIIPEAQQATPTKRGPLLVHTALGRTNGELFDSPTAAKAAATRYGINERDYEIAEHAGKNFILVSKTVDETSPNITKALTISTEGKTPDRNLFSWFSGQLTGTAETLSKAQRDNRNAVTHLATETGALLNELARGLHLGERRRVFGKKRLELINDVMRINQNLDGTGRGKFFETIGEVEEAWMKVHPGTLPDEDDLSAIFTFQKLSDLDWMMRSLLQYKTLARQGHREWQVPGSEWFTGRRAQNINWAGGDPKESILVLDKGEPQIFYKDELPPQSKLRQRIEKGEYTVIELGESMMNKEDGRRVLSEVTGSDQPIEWVVTKNADQRDLSVKQVPYNPGGHVVYPEKFFVKGLKLFTGRKGVKTADNDLTFLNVKSEAEAKHWSGVLNEVRLAFLKTKTGSKAERKAAREQFTKLVDNSLPISSDRARQLFSGSDGFDPKLPIGWVPEGKRLLDGDVPNGINKEDFGLVREPVNKTFVPGLDRQFTGERNNLLHKWDYLGSENKPVMDVSGATKIDPTLAIERGLAQILNTSTLDNYKVNAVNSFMNEFGGFLRNTNKDINPEDAFFKPDWVRETADNREALRQAKHVHLATENLLGRNTPAGNALEIVNMKLANKIFENKERIPSVLQNIELRTTNDPAKFFRSVGFHTKLGFFNPVQFFLQAQTLSNILAISPRHATQSMTAATLSRNLDINNFANINGKRTDIATKMGWKAADFNNAADGLTRSGFSRLGGEVANLDSQITGSLFQSKFGRILDKGRFFFDESESMVRRTSWFTAYRELKEAGKISKGRLSDADINSILTRANTLSVNMTRANNANWQKGFALVPTQFSAYNLRMMELYFGKQLTSAEKARMFMVHSALYGVGIGGAAAVGIPYAIGGGASNLTGLSELSGDVYDDIKIEAAKRQIDVDSGVWGLMMNGVMKAATDSLLGTDSNINTRLGPGTLSWIHEITSGEMSVVEAITGPSGNILTDIMKSAQPFTWSVANILNPDIPAERMDRAVVEILRNISTVSNGTKMWTALNHGVIRSKNREIQVGDIDKTAAIMAGLGFNPMALDDAFRFEFGRKQMAETRRWYSREFQKYMNKMYDSETQEDYERYNNLARVLLHNSGLTPVEIGKEFSRYHSDRIKREPFVDLSKRRFEQEREKTR